MAKGGGRGGRGGRGSKGGKGGGRGRGSKGGGGGGLGSLLSNTEVLKWIGIVLAGICVLVILVYGVARCSERNAKKKSPIPQTFNVKV